MATAHWASYMRQRAHAVRRLALRRSTTQSPPSKLSQASALLDPRIRGRSPLAHQQTHTLHPGHLCPLPPQSTCPCPRPGRGVCQILARCSLVAPKIAPKSLAAPRPSHYNISAGRRWPSKTPPTAGPRTLLAPCRLLRSSNNGPFWGFTSILRRLADQGSNSGLVVGPGPLPMIRRARLVVALCRSTGKP